MHYLRYTYIKNNCLSAIQQPDLYLAISGGSIDTKEINKFYKSDSTLPSQRAGCYAFASTPLSKPLKKRLKFLRPDFSFNTTKCSKLEGKFYNSLNPSM